MQPQKASMMNTTPCSFAFPPGLIPEKDRPPRAENLLLRPIFLSRVRRRPPPQCQGADEKRKSSPFQKPRRLRLVFTIRQARARRFFSWHIDACVNGSGKGTAYRRNGAKVMQNLDRGVGQVLCIAHLDVTFTHPSTPVGTCPVVFTARHIWCLPGASGGTSAVPLSWWMTSTRLPSTLRWR